jgi:integrase
MFSGMRASELRGLPWTNVDLDAGVIHVRQRADAWGKIGKPKSKAGSRDIPLAPIVINTLREWKVLCPKRETDKKDDAGQSIATSFNVSFVFKGLFHVLAHRVSG